MEPGRAQLNFMPRHQFASKMPEEMRRQTVEAIERPSREDQHYSQGRGLWLRRSSHLGLAGKAAERMKETNEVVYRRRYAFVDANRPESAGKGARDH